MQSLAKFLMVGGAVMLLCGALFYLGARMFPGGVPGDVAFRRGNTSFYFPLFRRLFCPSSPRLF
jgi:hypothetical protein